MATKKDTINFGIIGCGRISNQHLASIKNLPSAKLVMVCDVLEDRAKKIAAEEKVEYCLDYRELLDQKNIDVVSICTPHGLHAQMAIDTARAKKHALVEKPMTLNTAEIDDMIKEFKKAKRKIFPVLQVRFNPPVQYLKKLIKQNELDDIFHAALVIRWTRPEEYYDLEDWRGTKRMEGGSFLTLGIHYLDVLQWLLGPVKSVFAKINRVGHSNIEIEDALIGVISFKRGTIATVEFTTCTYPHNLECSISLLGKKGTVKLGGQAVNEIEVWEVENLPRPVLPTGLAPNVYAGGLYQGSCPNHVFVYQDLIENLNGTNSKYLDAQEARKTLEIIEGLYKSAECNQEIFYNCNIL